MDRIQVLEPVRLHTNAATHGRLSPFIGRLPEDLHLLILQYLPVPDIPVYARVSRALARLALADTVWNRRWAALGVDKYAFAPILDGLAEQARKKAPEVPPTLDVADDDFGDFSSGIGSSNLVQAQDLFVDTGITGVNELGNFVGTVTDFQSITATTRSQSSRTHYIRAHSLLIPLLPALLTAPHLILSHLFPPPAPTLAFQSKVIHLLSCFLSPDVRPLRDDECNQARSALRAGADRFEAMLLSVFDAADGRGDELAMREAAEASWEVWEPDRNSSGRSGVDWEMGRVWAEKREIFYTTGEHKPLDNFTPSGALNFEPMDDFIGFILDALREHGARSVRVFPPEAGVLLAFADRLASEVVGEYITPLLTHARSLSNGTIFLTATAASFREAWRMVGCIVEVSRAREASSTVDRIQAEDVVYRMFEPNMDEYLDEEVEAVKRTFEHISREWEKKSPTTLPPADSMAMNQPSFLTSSSPAHLKRSVLTSFTDMLLLPVALVPRVGETVAAGAGAAVQGIAMLDPRRWAGQGGGAMTSYTADTTGYQRGLEEGVLWEDDEKDRDEDEDEDEDDKESENPNNAKNPTTKPSLKSMASSKQKKMYDNLQLLISLDVTLELIHAARESLKRVETFVGYPGAYGHRVRDTMEEIAVEMMKVLGDRHVKGGFELAISQMRTYQPPAITDVEGGSEEKAAAAAEVLASTSTSVAPLVQFFELVHIGDMIQSIVQVYFDKELAPHVDVSDFLNSVVREKKRFENILDDSVAKGLNAGIEVLMNQVEHIILTLTPPRTYYPPEDAPMELGPTKGCTEAIRCLQEHLRLLKGNVNREVLEVFEGEVGERLIGILQKHIKRQIISLNGGFQVIADLNAYHAFISTLKIPSLTAGFAHLKMLGHVYIVDDAKDLAQIVRDVTRYGGSYRPEDLYEFVQRRSDWKKIEKVVDKTMYNLNLREDCVVC
ncbi:hypothetical protein EVG20_g2160 [Dentipellis fragilis]|uniref:F-box domain-containing protein n=1 Tax=Dentipellis fragilis TaxID=205917 RepID=A0A4Y9Z8K2_9AGAM|nr:hypothetical protein EVG20_g2160 [Dentipellis fragilis]